MAHNESHGRLRLGTRGSQLARWQAEWVAGELRRRGHEVQLIEIATSGDVQRAAPIEEIGTRGVFTKEIQLALLVGDVDIAVHSLKDLPTEPVEGLVLAAVPERESTADVLVVAAKSEGRNARGGESLPVDEARLDPSLALLSPGARVGTGSLRRQAQLRHARPDLRCGDVRGNVDTRLRKLDEGQFDAIVLAEAGLRRLGLANRIRNVLPFEVMFPAVGQGALGIECRSEDASTLAVVASLEDAGARAAVTAERTLLAHLRGGCMAPIGARSCIEGGILQLSAVVLSADGSRRIAANQSAPLSEARSLGVRVADELLAAGAAALISTARQP